jgi:hypothetical protein
MMANRSFETEGGLGETMNSGFASYITKWNIGTTLRCEGTRF